MKKILLLLLLCISLGTCCTPKTSTRPKLKDIVIEQPVRPMRIVLDTMLTPSQADSLYKADSLGFMWSQKIFLSTYPNGAYSQEIFIKYTDSVTIKYSIDKHSQDSLYHVVKRIE